MKLCWVSGLVDGQCLSHLSSVVAKHRGQGNLEKEVFIWALRFQRSKIPLWQGDTQQASDMVTEAGS